MTGIEPGAVSAFLSHVDGARSHVGRLATELGGITPEADAFDASMRLVGARDALGQVVRSLQDARLNAAPLDAAEAARLVAVDRARDVRLPLDDLEALFASGAHLTKPDEVVALANQAQAATRRIAAWELDDIAARATDPTAGTSTELGAVTANGTWQPIAASPLAELEGIARTIGQQHSDLFDDLSDIGRRSGPDGDQLIADGARWDEEIAADELSRALDGDDAVARLTQSTTSGSASLAADADELARIHMAPASYQEIIERAAVPRGEYALPGAGTQRLLTLMPANMTDLAIVQHADSASLAGTLPLQYKATGKFATVPTRTEAFELAAGRQGHWFVMPHADGSWRVVEAQPHPEMIKKLTGQVRLGTDASRIEQQAGRIDGYFVDGQSRLVSGPKLPDQYSAIITNAGDEPIGRTAFSLREVGGLEPHVDGVAARIRPGQVSGTSVVPGSPTSTLLEAAPKQGDVVTVVQYRRNGGSVELPMAATGRSVQVPTRDAALQLAAAHPDARWAILPDAKAGWHVVEVAAVGDNIAEVNAIIKDGGAISGMRQSLGRVDALVQRGKPTFVGEPPQLVVGDVVRSMEKLLAPSRPLRIAPTEVAAADAPLVSITKPGRRGREAVNLQLRLAERGDATTLEATQAAAVEHLANVAKHGPRRGVHALVEREPGRYAVVRLDHPDLDRHAFGALLELVGQGTAPATLDPRIRAIAVGNGRGVSVAHT